MALLVVLPLLLGLVGLGAASMPVAAATGSDATPQDVVYNIQYRLISDNYQGQFSGDWVTCVYATAESYAYQIGCSESVTVTAGVSGDAGFSYGELSGEVGFNVSVSESLGSNAEWNIAKYQSGWGQVGFRYNQYQIGQEDRTCIPVTGYCSAWSNPDYITVQNVLAPTYQFVA
jgi:hypothetical protein